LGVNPKVITSAINIAMAQRLVRKLCPVCRKNIVLGEKENKLIKNTTESILNKDYLEGLEMDNVYEAVGCAECNFTGFKGRTGIYEAVITDETIENAVIKNPSEREINKASENQGILNMKQDGIIKVLKGITSLDELSRVIDLEE
jgi:type II secretory ATPase GspE/PulE/Tfp pilus assembly ATPase PilB-like protein